MGSASHLSRHAAVHVTMNQKRLLTLAGVTGLIVLVLVLAGNLAVAHDNPLVTQAIAWDSPQTEQLARAACFDCHSNETKWPWYSFVAPISFLIEHNVTNGRSAVNLSTYDTLNGREFARQIRSGEMPPAAYLALHPEARLTDAQKAALMAGFEATFVFAGGQVGE